MEVFTKIRNLENFLKTARSRGKIIGLVPTMGALHEGHRALIDKCREECEIVIVSIFVNPRQFNNQEDLQKYPRNLSRDLELLNQWKADVAFAPKVEEMYPARGKNELTINFGEAERILEGKFRPGHFSGVALIVSKLFNILQPDRAYFGLKDLQQCFIIDQLVKNLSFSVRIKFVKTVREKNGLAISSRNARLTNEARSHAPVIHEALQEAKRIIASTRSIKRGLTASMKVIKRNKNIRLEYIQAVDMDTFEIISSLSGRKKIAICIAAYLEDVRLIDNMIIYPK